MSQGQAHAEFPRLWIVVVLIVWAVGLNQSIILTRAKTAAPDRFRDIPMYEPAREILGDAITADYLTDFRKKNKTIDRFWRAQYVVVPTVLRIRYSADLADKNARTLLTQGQRYYRIVEFRDRATLLDSRRRLQEISREFGGFFEELPVADRLVVLTVRTAADD